MAIVYPDTDPTQPPAAEGTGQRLKNFAENHIVLAGALALGMALLLGYVINKIRGGSSTSSTNQQPQTLYVPTSTTYQNNYTTTDSNNTTNNPPGIVPVPPSPIGPPAQKPPPTPGYYYATVGAQGGPPQGSSVQQVANWAHEALGNIYADNPWLGNINGPFGAGQSYNPNLPGNVNNEEFKLYGIPPSAGTGIGGDPFKDGHLPFLRTIFSVNHGVTHHVQNVIGA